jgi:precorrin-6B methylase 1
MVAMSIMRSSPVTKHKLRRKINLTNLASSSIQSEPGKAIRLYLVGAGVSFPEHLTLQSVKVLSSCNVIRSNLPAEDLARLPAAISAKCESLWPLYQESRNRTANYDDVTREVVQAALDLSPIAWLTPGHPLIFDSVSQALLQIGQERGWQVIVVPAVSSIDTVCADIGYDPANGLIVHEAMGAVQQKLQLIPAVATLLLQPSAFGSELAHYTETFQPDLSPLRAYLLQFYPPDFRCAFVRSHSLHGGMAQIRWFEIGAVHQASFLDVAGSTLFIPPLLWDARYGSVDARVSTAIGQGSV